MGAEAPIGLETIEISETIDSIETIETVELKPADRSAKARRP